MHCRSGRGGWGCICELKSANPAPPIAGVKTRQNEIELEVGLCQGLTNGEPWEMTQLYITTTTTTKGGKISINPLSCHLTSYVSSRPSRHLCAGGQTHISLSPSQPAALIPSLSDHPSNPLSPIQVSQASSSLVNIAIPACLTPSWSPS